MVIMYGTSEYMYGTCYYGGRRLLARLTKRRLVLVRRRRLAGLHRAQPPY